MHSYLPALAFTASMVYLAVGIITAYRQSRLSGPVARVPTLPWALQASVLFVIGLALLRYEFEWWVYGCAFIGAALAFGLLIMSASAKP
jgi:hypothetical protein